MGLGLSELGRVNSVNFGRTNTNSLGANDASRVHHTRINHHTLTSEEEEEEEEEAVEQTRIESMKQRKRRALMCSTRGIDSPSR
jgi:hypothetical protein